jgi:serine/threonine protein kinase
VAKDLLAGSAIDLIETHLVRYKVSLEAAIGHPLVKATLGQASNELNLSETPVPIYQGGHGLLYLIRSKEHEQRLLKLPSYATRSPDEHWILRGFISKEGSILAEVKCGALSKLFHCHSDGYYLVREFVPGERLSDIKCAGPLQVKLLALLLQTASSVFNAFHQKQTERYVLRDFKAKNLIVSMAHEEMKLIDVDSVRPENEMLSGNPNPDWVGSGKWLHWSPEQLLEQREWLDYRTDYFALGVTAYSLLVGAHPYTNRTKRPELVIQSYLQEYEAAKKRLKEVTRSLLMRTETLEFLVQCLHPIPHNRPAAFWIDP